MDNNIRRPTVCFICKDKKVLLALIENEYTYWNGIGGWAEIGESAENAVIREIFEETYIIVDKSHLKLVLKLGNLHIFITHSWSGEIKIKEPSLKELRWFSFDEIPWEMTIKGTEEWLPKILEENC